MTPADRDRIQARIRICEDALHGHDAHRIITEHRTSPDQLRRVLRTAGWPDRAAVATHLAALQEDLWGPEYTARATGSGKAWTAHVVTQTGTLLERGTPPFQIVEWLGYRSPLTLARCLARAGREDLAAAISPGRQDTAA